MSHIPSLTKVDQLLDYFSIFENENPKESGSAQKLHTVKGLKEDIDFVLSRIEMIENKMNKFSEIDYEEDVHRWLRHIKEVLK